ncbi:MAG: class II D-tagatose-bisphosphate aldolase, non-catalytic subunit [Anaerolineales bacterium]|nr:class II D-tagatose-bisphosphate aldolase, non-catalytic subunit [Anaerolineales bacterium]
MPSGGIQQAWPCFVVAQVGTDLHTTHFDPSAAQKLTEVVRPLGSLLKGHYTDWVYNAEAYPASGMGGANVGPEFTAAEFQALQELDQRDARLIAIRNLKAADFISTLEGAVVASNRWQKWLQPDEVGCDFAQLAPARRLWLAQTGARYVWTAPAVVAARRVLYSHLTLVAPDPHAYVVDRVAHAIERYVDAFGLFAAATLLYP